MICRNCNAQNPDNAVQCSNCGAPLTVAQPMYQQPQQPMYMQPASVPGKGLGIASMVLGIISLACFCLWYVAIACALIGVVLGGVGIAKAKQVNAKNGMAVAGLVCSIISLAVALIIVATGAAILESIF